VDGEKEAGVAGKVILPQIFAARQSRNQKETPTTEARRHGENQKQQWTVRQSHKYREHTELPKTRRAEEKTEYEY